MSMLAERKRKQKWSLNPRGKAWASDANKFGQKMLEKMGWQQGKGLGAKESGITEYLKVSYKNDTQGMGYKDSGEEWTEHENNFSALLESLSHDKKKTDEIIVNSLEEKSQTSRARVHYHKFTRGKDLSLYSKKDLANIFGKRDLNEIKNVDPVQSEFQEEISEVDQTNFFNRGSMKDYFKEKLYNTSNTTSYILNNSIKKVNSESDSEGGRAGFGFKLEEFKDGVNEAKHIYKSSHANNATERKHDDSENIFSTKKIKKVKLKVSDMDSSLTLSNCHDIGQNSNVSEIHSSSPNCNKYENLVTNDGKSLKKENNFDLNESPSIKSKRKKTSETNDSFEEASSKKSKTNKRKFVDLDVGICNPVFESNIDENLRNSETLVGLANFEVNRKKSKKTNVIQTNYEGINNPIFKEEITEVFDYGSMNNSITENPYEVKLKKKKEKKQAMINSENEGTCNIKNFDHIEALSNQNGNKIKRNPKKYGISNPSFEDLIIDALESCGDMHAGVVKKKNSKKNKREIKDSSMDCQMSPQKQIVAESIGTDEVVGIKTKKNKKKKEKSTEKNDSNISQNCIPEECNLMLNVVSKPCINESVKSKQKKMSEVKGNNKKRKSVRFSDITQEHIIPNNELLKMMENDSEAGYDNLNFDSIQAHVDENLEGISKTLDIYQAEIENDINEQKQTTFEDIMVGEIQDPHGENEKLSIGTKLKFKFADFDTRTPMYQLNKTGAKKSYKHLIKGDIILKFPNTNLHEIHGYASVKRKK